VSYTKLLNHTYVEMDMEEWRNKECLKNQKGQEIRGDQRRSDRPRTAMGPHRGEARKNLRSNLY
jgi:hypothetical protein